MLQKAVREAGGPNAATSALQDAVQGGNLAAKAGHPVDVD